MAIHVLHTFITGIRCVNYIAGMLVKRFRAKTWRYQISPFASLRISNPAFSRAPNHSCAKWQAIIFHERITPALPLRFAPGTLRSPTGMLRNGTPHSGARCQGYPGDPLRHLHLRASAGERPAKGAGRLTVRDKGWVKSTDLPGKRRILGHFWATF